LAFIWGKDIPSSVSLADSWPPGSRFVYCPGAINYVAGERDWDREWEWDRKGEIELVARLLLLAPCSLVLLAVSVGGAASFACPRPGKGLCCGRRPLAEVIARKKSLGQLFPPLFFYPYFIHFSNVYTTWLWYFLLVFANFAFSFFTMLCFALALCHCPTHFSGLIFSCLFNDCQAA